MSVILVPGLDSLVVGIDGSAHSAAALRWAASALVGDGVLHVVHAVTPISVASIPNLPMSNLGLSELESSRQADQAKARRLLEEALTTTSARSQQRTLKTHLKEGMAADALLRTAGDQDAAGIVVGAHGARQSRHILGSVTRRLLHRSPLPTIVVQAGTDQDDRRADHGRPVIACIGYGEATDNAAHWAADYAAAKGLPLTLVHVVGYRPVFPADPPEDVLASYLGPTVGPDWAKTELENLKMEIRAKLPDLAIATTVDVGFATRGIQKAGAGAALTVLGKRHSNAAVRAAISPRIHRILTRSTTPVAVVPLCTGQ